MTWGKKQKGSITVVLYPETGAAVKTFAKVMGMSHPEAIAFVVKKSALVRRALRLARGAEREPEETIDLSDPAQAAPFLPPPPPAPEYRDPFGQDVPKQILVIARRVQEKDPTNSVERRALREWMLGDDEAVNLLPPEEEPAPQQAVHDAQAKFYEGRVYDPFPAGEPLQTSAESPEALAAATVTVPAPPALPEPPPEPPPPPKLLVRRDALAPDRPAWVAQIVGLFGEGIDVPPEVMTTFRAWQRGEDVNPEGKLLVEEDEG